MSILLKRFAMLILALISMVSVSFAQGDETASTPAAMTPDVASTVQILDTSNLFVNGAREAAQAIRGSFGWPTFQEGFVDKVYFRFDPDGYARFSTSPRLDVDIFEVICNGTPQTCLAQKPGLQISVTPAGQVALNFVDMAPTDYLFLSDHTTELPLPAAVKDPLDIRLETLLAAGGDLIIKRELETLQTISLTGFSAVATYLRWVAQHQDPSVFPPGWPMPAQQNMAAQVAPVLNRDGWQQDEPVQASNSFLAQANLQSSGIEGLPTGNGAFQNNIGQQLQQPAGAQNLANQVTMTPMENGNVQHTIEMLRNEIAQLKMQNQNDVPQASQLITTPMVAEPQASFVQPVETAWHDELAGLAQQLSKIDLRLNALETQLTTLNIAQNSNAQGTEVPPIAVDSQPALVDTTEILDRLLTRRIDEPVTQAAVQNQNPAGDNNALVNKIITELNTAETTPPMPETADEEGFVNLTDYLNNILRNDP